MLFRYRYSLRYSFLKCEIHDLDTSIRNRIHILYTNYFHNRLSNIELDPITYGKLRKISPQLGKAASPNNILSQNIFPPKKANILANLFPKAEVIAQIGPPP